MHNLNILWADDEIELLKPHIQFLKQRNCDVLPVNNGEEAVELCQKNHFDIVFLDESMPGISGLDALAQIKSNKPTLPVVMITKNEAEKIMEEAIGSKIDDYLLKPINPNQILSCIKKILDNERLVTEKTTLSYQQDFRQISMALQGYLDHRQWADLYRRIVFWEIELRNTKNAEMGEVLLTQKAEANAAFSQFVKKNYDAWLNSPNVDRPLMSHQLLKKKLFPEINSEKPTFFILIDNLRLDQWKSIESALTPYFNIDQEDLYYSILPTVTAYSRNSIFSGMLPLEIARNKPHLWVGEDEEETKNDFEEDFLQLLLTKNNLRHKFTYHKITQLEHGRNLAENILNLINNPLTVIVYNFVDMLSHARTNVSMVRELTPDEAAYCSLTKSWFEHSPLLDMLKKISERGARVILTTDHGTIRVKRPFKVIGDKNVNTNLRYKQGKSLSIEGNQDKIMVSNNPERLHLPQINMSTSYIFATGDQFFVYPNNYNYYANYFKDTFQHGGISLEEVIVPVVTLTSKNG